MEHYLVLLRLYGVELMMRLSLVIVDIIQTGEGGVHTTFEEVKRAAYV